MGTLAESLVLQTDALKELAVRSGGNPFANTHHGVSRFERERQALAGGRAVDGLENCMSYASLIGAAFLVATAAIHASEAPAAVAGTSRHLPSQTNW
jgi:hypothetical protein